MDPLVVVGIIAAVAGPIGAYLIAARQFSGKIESSDATQLWEESRSMREWSATRMGVLDLDINRLQLRVQLLEEGNSELQITNRALLAEIAELKTVILGLRDEIHTLGTALKVSKARVVELEEDESNGGQG